MAAGLTQTTHTPSIDTILERLLDDMEAPPDAYASEPPVWAKDPFNGGYAESCGRCGSWCEVVRPGKTQCPHCWDDPDRAVRINAAAALNPVNLVALALLATPHHAIELRLLERQLDLLAELQRRLPGAAHASLPAGTAADWIEQALALGMVQRREQPLGDIILADAGQAALLGWYRNNVLHLFALTGLVAFAFRHQPAHGLDELEALLAPGWPILARELMVEPPASLREALSAMLAVLGELGLLARGESGWQRPREPLEAGECLDLLGQLMQPSLERGYLLLAVLLNAGPGRLTAEALADQGHQLAERLALLSGRDAPEFFDTRLFVSLVESLEEEGWLWREEERLMFDDRLCEAAHHSRRLFDPALRHRLQLVTRQA